MQIQRFTININYVIIASCIISLIFIIIVVDCVTFGAQHMITLTFYKLVKYFVNNYKVENIFNEIYYYEKPVVHPGCYKKEGHLHFKNKKYLLAYLRKQLPHQKYYTFSSTLEGESSSYITLINTEQKIYQLKKTTKYNYTRKRKIKNYFCNCILCTPENKKKHHKNNNPL